MKQMDKNYNYIGINSTKKQQEILNILSYIKEIRNTAYPLENSNITELKIDNFVARKEKDIILINGDLSLTDGDTFEKRTFEAYIMNIDTKEVRIYMDITRENVTNEPKMIRTTEEIIFGKEITVITKYNQMEGVEEKKFTSIINTNEPDDFWQIQATEQLSTL